MSISSFWVHSSDLTTQMTPQQTSVCIGNKPNLAYNYQRNDQLVFGLSTTVVETQIPLSPLSIIICPKAQYIYIYNIRINHKHVPVVPHEAVAEVSE